MLFKKTVKTFLLTCLSIYATYPSSAYASQTVIRDAEIESYIHEWSKDVINAAGFSPSQINIVLIESPDVNAFVAGGTNIFIYTGLLNKTSGADEVVSVIAHELGHISGGHLTRTRDVMENASFEAMAATILGIGAALATGNSGAAAAGAAIGQSTGINSFLSFSRIQESSADQAGFKFLQTAGINPSGSITFLEKISSEELLPTSSQSAFMRTHPLSRDRIDALQSKVENSPLRTKPSPENWAGQYARMKAKSAGFITPQQVTYLYKSQDNQIPSLYARAIAAYRMNKTSDSLKLINQLIEKEPNNPYFYELKGQALYEFGQVKESIIAYKKSIDLLPSGSGLMRIAYAQSLIESGGNMNEAITQLKRAELDEPRAGRTKRLLATAYGKQGDEVRARVYLAEEAMMQGRLDQAKSMAKDCLSKLPPKSPEYIRARDIIELVDSKGEN